MTGIYKITSPSGKVYIGQSINIEKRITYYKSLNCYGQRKSYHSLKKYGWEQHKFEIIEKCNIDDLIKKENYWKDYYNSINDGLNCRKDGKFGYDSEETKLLKSKSKLGNNYAYGHIKSKNTKKLIGDKMKNHPSLKDKHRCDKIKKFKSKPVLQYDLEGNFIREWNSAKEAAVTLYNKINGSDINACCRGKQKTAYGYIWRNKI